MRISTTDLITLDQADLIRRAIGHVYGNQRAFAERRSLGEDQLSRILNRRLVPNSRYARELDRAIVQYEKKQSAKAATA